MPFDPSQPSEPVTSVAPPGGFDPSQPSELVAPAPSAALKPPPDAPTGQKSPDTSRYGLSDWNALYSGLDGLDQRLSGAQKTAFAGLDSVTDNPKEARAKAINQAFISRQMPGMDPQLIQNNWDAVKSTYAKAKLGLDQKDIPDTALYGQISKRLQADADEQFGEIKPWTWRETLDSHVGGIERSASQFWESLWKPARELPEAPADLPNNPALGLGNPALAGGVWNGVKPIFESMESLGGIATGEAGELAAGSKVAIAGIKGLFTAIMGYQAIKGAPEMARVLKDPNASFQAQVQAVTGEVANSVLAIAAPLEAAVKARPEVSGEIEGKTPEQAAAVLREHAAAPDATFEQTQHLDAAADQLEKVAEGTPPSKQIEGPGETAQAWDEIKRVFAPASRGDKAEVTAGSLREHGGELAQRTDRAAAALEDASKQLMKMEPEKRWDAVDSIEKGEPLDDPKLQPFADATRAILDTKRDEIRAFGTGKLEHFIEDYFPHIWKDPERATRVFQEAQAKAPMEGAKSFLKERSIPTIKQGLAYGLEPVTNNPVEMVLLRAREMDKYILGQKWLAEMKDRDFVEFVRAGQRPPEGYEAINDKIATVYGTPSHPGATQIEGKYYAPSEVATVANNYLSPGLRRFASFRAYLSMANTLNQFQLGLSAFHLGFTSIDTSISKLALAMDYASQGKGLKAAGKVAQIPVAPFSTVIQGSRVLSEWMRPGSQGEDFGKIVDMIRHAGGRAKMDNFYKTTITRRMTDLFKQGGVKGTVGGLWRVPFAAMEQISKPMMEYLVPRQKLGVAADMMRMELERMPKDASVEDVRKVAGKVWDSVDNRMGQMVYDNVFWNKAVKDLAMASVRSVGWNLGTLRELGGGVIDTGKFLKDAVTPKQKAEFTRRMGYAISLPIMTGILGATYQYMKTGKGPDEMRDYFFPKTGEKDPQGRDVRLSTPTYMKDVYHYAHDPVGTVEGKVHPFISAFIQAVNNKDYFGRDIRNSDDPVVKQLADEAKHFLENYEPIGIRQYAISKAAGQTNLERAENFIGITRAPAWVGETDAEQLAGKLAGDHFKSAASPDSELVAQKNRIMSALRNGNPEQKQAASDELDSMVTDGRITDRQAKNILRGVDHSYLENAFSHLSAQPAQGDILKSEAMRVFKLASPKEREALKEQFIEKLDRSKVTDEEYDAAIAKIEALTAKRKPSYSSRP